MERFSENKQSNESYKPFSPRGDRKISSRAEPVGELIKIGSLYYLSQETLKGDIKTISNYQQWAELGWKEPHGTPQASARFLGKLNEEIEELIEANSNLLSKNDNYEYHINNFIEELGDIMWCVTALSSNSSADISQALKFSILDHTLSQIADIDKNNKPWKNHAIDISLSKSNIAIHNIDNLISRGFEPKIIVQDSNIKVEEHIEWLSLYAHEMDHYIDLQYSLTKSSTQDNPAAIYDDYADKIASIASDIYLNITYIANSRLGETLGNIINMNVRKLNQRMQNNQIDKKDNPRDKSIFAF